MRHRIRVAAIVVEGPPVEVHVSHLTAPPPQEGTLCGRREVWRTEAGSGDCVQQRGAVARTERVTAWTGFRTASVP